MRWESHPESSSHGKGPRAGKVFQDHRALQIKYVCFHTGICVYINWPKTQNKCVKKYTTECSSQHTSKHWKAGPLSPLLPSYRPVLI